MIQGVLRVDFFLSFSHSLVDNTFAKSIACKLSLNMQVKAKLLTCYNLNV
jgi:hypothetical protein